MSYMGQGQYMQVHVQDEDYEHALATAMQRLDAKTLSRVVLSEDQAEPGDWYVANVSGELSLGGTTIGLQVTFRRQGT